MSRTEALCVCVCDLLLFIPFIVYIGIMYVPLPTHRSLPKSAPYTTVLNEFVGSSTENKACFTKQLTHCIRNEINMRTESDVLLERIRRRMACHVPFPHNLLDFYQLTLFL